MKKFIITIVCFGLIANNVLGQEAQTSVSFYTGTMGLNVPIYTINDPDFTLPISLSYTANAFMPEQEQSVVGMNWELNAGSRITRKVYGLPDDYRLNKAQHPYNGRINQLIKGENFYDKTQISLLCEVLGDSFAINPFNYSPDMFYFNINGVNGWFYIDFQGEIVVVCNDPVTVDLKKFSDNVSNTDDVPIIKLIDKNGYTYIYGGNDTTYYSKILNTKLSEYSNYSVQISYIDSWYLSKIIAPNKREMNFEYNTISKSTLGVALNEEFGNTKQYLEVDNLTNLWQQQNYRPSSSKYILPLLKKIKITDIDFEMNFNYTTTDATLTILNYMKCPEDHVTQIPHGNGGYIEETIHWRCGCDWERDGLSYNYKGEVKGKDKVNPGTDAWCDAWEPIISKESHLTSISVRQENDTKICKFSYTPEQMCNRMGSPNKVTGEWKYPYKRKRYLTKIETFEDTEYSFEYNFDYTQEESRKKNYQPMSQLLDIYGYSVYNPQYGMLKSVTNPLGGKTAFTYEPHRYSQVKMYGYNSDNQCDIVLLPATTQNLYKNLRIKKIKNFDENNNLVVSKSYYYDKNQYKYLRDMNEEMFVVNDNWECSILAAMNNGTASAGSTEDNNDNTSVPQVQTALYSFQNISSGMLHCDFANEKPNGKFEVFDRKKLQSAEPIPVTYSEITEEITYPTGKKQSNIYKFFDYASMPDFVEKNTTDITSAIPSRYSYSFTSQSQRRGLLREQQIFEDDTKIRTIKFSYAPLKDENNPENRNYILSNLATLGMTPKKIYQKMYYAHTKPISITTTDYINGSEITASTNFIYDAKNRLSEKITDEIDGRKYFTKYRYADDIVPVLQSSRLGFAGGFQQIQRQGWLGRPVEVVSGYYVGETAHYTGGTISLFRKASDRDMFNQELPASPAFYLTHASPYTPTYTNFATLSQEWSLVLYEPITDYVQMMTNSAGNIVFDQTNYIKIADYEYNDKLRLTKVKPANALETVYVWDNKNHYPISETTGRFTTAYTFKPMVGNTSVTDIRGIKTLYEYDIYGRLNKAAKRKPTLLQ